MTTNNPEPIADDLLEDDRVRPLEIRLQMELGAGEPADAVNRFIDEVARRGFDDFVYRVRDPQTEETWFVQHGMVFTVDEWLTDAQEVVDETETAG